MTLPAKTDTFEIVLTETRLGELETAVRSGLASFVAVGQALIAIQEGRGYRLRGYKTFEAYCEREFGFTDRHGRRMIAAAQTAERVQAVLGEAPANESVARVLTPFADDPITLKKVQARLDKKKRSLATAPAELVAEVIADVTGKKHEPPPAPVSPRNGQKQLLDVPAQETGGLLLQACQAAHEFLMFQKAFRRDPGYLRVMSLLDKALKLHEPQPVREGHAPAASGPRCPSCKADITPGDIFCQKCGAAL